MIKRIISVIVTITALCLCASALADDILCQSYDAPIGGETRRVNVYLTSQAGGDDEVEPSYRIEVEGVSQPDEMLFTNSESPNIVKLLCFIDINFDGYTDIAAVRTAGATDAFADFFVYDPLSGTFVANKTLSSLSLFRAVLYPAQGLIENYVHDSAATGTWELYDWKGEGNSLRLLRTASLLFDDFEMTAMRDTVIGYAPDGTQTVLYDNTHPVIEDDDEYNKIVDTLMDLLWQGYDSTEMPVYIESNGELTYRANILYNNPDGGHYYHTSSFCPSVSDKYLPLTAFDGALLDAAPYNTLKPCPQCAVGE